MQAPRRTLGLLPAERWVLLGYACYFNAAIVVRMAQRLCAKSMQSDTCPHGQRDFDGNEWMVIGVCGEALAACVCVVFSCACDGVRAVASCVHQSVQSHLAHRAQELQIRAAVERFEAAGHCTRTALFASAATAPHSSPVTPVGAPEPAHSLRVKLTLGRAAQYNGGLRVTAALTIVRDDGSVRLCSPRCAVLSVQVAAVR
jgi:hypothetical protein